MVLFLYLPTFAFLQIATSSFTQRNLIRLDGHDLSAGTFVTISRKENVKIEPYLNIAFLYVKFRIIRQR